MVLALIKTNKAKNVLSLSESIRHSPTSCFLLLSSYSSRLFKCSSLIGCTEFRNLINSRSQLLFVDLTLVPQSSLSSFPIQIFVPYLLKFLLVWLQIVSYLCRCSRIEQKSGTIWVEPLIQLNWSLLRGCLVVAEWFGAG